MDTGQLCSRKPITVHRSDDLIRAAQLMREKHIGYLVVVDSDADQPPPPVGVVTDRDIVIAVVAREADARELRVGDIMTRPPITIGEAEPVEKALREMRRVGVRRLPVVGKAGELIGVISLDDVLEVLATDLQHIAASVRHQRQIEGSLRP